MKLRRRVKKLEADTKHLRDWVKGHHGVLGRLDGDLKREVAAIYTNFARRGDVDRLEEAERTSRAGLDRRLRELEQKQKELEESYGNIYERYDADVVERRIRASIDFCKQADKRLTVVESEFDAIKTRQLNIATATNTEGGERKSLAERVRKLEARLAKLEKLERGEK